MDKKLLGVIDATTYQKGLEDLIQHRSLAAVPFGGRYRLIDFILSNMVNSGINSVAIFPKNQYRSLMDHLGSGKDWDLNRKRDGLFFFPAPAEEKEINSFSLFAANKDFFDRSNQQYVLISNCFTVCNMNFQPILDWHIKSGCDITEVRRDGRSLHMFLIKKSLLVDLFETREQTGYTCMRDVVTDINSPYRQCHYEFKGYAVMIDSIATYFNESMKLLDPSIWKELFLKNQPVYTKVKDEPPTRYFTGATVKNSVIANGCLIEGTVENSIISRAVKIGKGSVVKNSIIMQKCQIGENCVLDSVVLDKDVKVNSGTMMYGTKELPYVVRKGTVQGALMNS
jgi:glucose-1-phosphate adenylyltransferase